MKQILSRIFFLGCLISSVYANDTVNIDAKVEQAQKEGKVVMLYFHIPNCAYCKRMLDENFHDKTILELIRKHLLLIDVYTADERVYVHKHFKGSAKAFAKYMGAIAYPATLFMGVEGEVLYKAIGYRNVQEYSNEIKFITTRSYQTMSLEEFILKLEMADENE